MRKNYSDEGQWYLKGSIEKLYKIYQKILRQTSSLDGHAVIECSQCQIEFITTQSNRKRQDIRCPFGCRLAHRKVSSNKRSIEYNKTPEGKFKKKALNQRRNKVLIASKQESSSTLNSIIMDRYIRLIFLAVFKSKLDLLSIQRLRYRSKEELRQHGLEQTVELLIVRGYG